LPSYKKLNQHSQEAQEIDSQLLLLQKKRDSLFSEFDKLTPHCSRHSTRSFKAKQRQEEIEREIDSVATKISQLKMRMRQLGMYARE
jgi:uncharacterized coiled-coil DUF342 family protein